MSGPTKRYVLGFLFRRDGSEVALIHKLRPDNQVGTFNGIGGKIEDGEDAYETMRREFREEAGADVGDWSYYASLVGQGFMVDCFHVTRNDVEIRTMTDEPVSWVAVSGLTVLDKINPEARWLIPMALSGRVKVANVMVR